MRPYKIGVGPNTEEMCDAKEENIGFCYVLKEAKAELLDQPCTVKDRRQ